ncbi:MAG: hypothetical protein ABFD29_09730 [Anaerolineaceae bacterium]
MPARISEFDRVVIRIGIPIPALWTARLWDQRVCLDKAPQVGVVPTSLRYRALRESLAT